MAQYDIKRLATKTIVHKYNGVMGSIRSIDTHPTLPLIATASIDQFVRIHHAETYRQVSKVRISSSSSSTTKHFNECFQFQFYLKSRLTSVLFAPHEIVNHQEQKEQQVEEKVDEEIENDEVWSQFKRKLPKHSQDRYIS